MIRTEGLTHVHLLVKDVQRSLAFYTTVFGMVEQFWDGPTMVFLRTAGARDTVTLNQVEGPITGGAVDHIGFRRAEGQSLEAAIAEVVAAGGRLVERGEHTPGRPFAYVADPDGHLIEL